MIQHVQIENKEIRLYKKRGPIKPLFYQGKLFFLNQGHHNPENHPFF